MSGNSLINLRKVILSYLKAKISLMAVYVSFLSYINIVSQKIRGLTRFIMISVSPMIEPFENILKLVSFCTMPQTIKKTSSDLVLDLIS